jgi:dTMP kinase
MKKRGRRRGLFITLEGGEGSGKSTQARVLARALRQRGLRVELTREPGEGPLGREIRKILLRARRDIPPLAELFLYEADRAAHVERVRAALSSHDAVISDRFHDSTVVYQGFARGLDRRLIHDIHRAVLGGMAPDITVVVDIPADAGLLRARARNRAARTARAEGRFEAEALAFHRKVRRGYLALARREPRRVRVVDGTGSVREVHARVLALVEPILKGGAGRRGR